jgi:hypothetical protein
MDTLDDIIRSTFVVDAEPDNKDGKAAYPDFPGEKPSKVELVSWLDKWDDGLNSLGYAAPLRGDVPYDVKKLTLETQNAAIDHDNKNKK